MAASTESRRQIVAPPKHWEQFEAAAAKANLSLSAWMGQACLEKLPKKVVAQLPKRKGLGRPPGQTSGKTEKGV